MRFTDPVNTIEPLHLRKEVLMGQILNFPTKKIEPGTVRSRQKHRIAVEILDGVRARRTRWIVQFETANLLIAISPDFAMRPT